MIKTDDPFISIVIPVYNSGYLAEDVIKKLDHLLKNSYSYEIIFGNDGSEDSSSIILAEISKRYSNIRYISHVNRGIGYTLNRLFQNAKGKIFVYLDMDLSFEIGHLMQMIEHLKIYDIAVASKYLSSQKYSLPFFRKFFSRIYYRYCKLFFEIPVKDIGSGMIAFKASIINDIKFKIEGFNFHLEFYNNLKKCKIIEVDVPYSHQKGSFKIISHFLPVLKELLTYTLKTRL